jgi:hypothetical protein
MFKAGALHLPVFFTASSLDGSVVIPGRILVRSVVFNGGLVVVVFAGSKNVNFQHKP